VPEFSIATVIFAIVLIWVLFPFFFPISGIYKRDVDDEYIQFEQFGPIVTGKRNVDGGNQLYSGFQNFIWLSLKRRDYGLPALIAQGFPEVIAKKLNGSIVAQMKLRRRGKELVGSFIPQKILFDESSIRILSRHYQPASLRHYARANLSELPTLKVEAKKQENLPPLAAKKIQRKNTF